MSERRRQLLLKKKVEVEGLLNGVAPSSDCDTQWAVQILRWCLEKYNRELSVLASAKSFGDETQKQPKGQAR
jgi:hypothetical protein